MDKNPQPYNDPSEFDGVEDANVVKGAWWHLIYEKLGMAPGESWLFYGAVCFAGVYISQLSHLAVCASALVAGRFLASRLD